eukprot:3628033-Heterocapsa_arctica.AAC.1
MWGTAKGDWQHMGNGKNWKGKGEGMPQKGYWDSNYQGKKNQWDNGPPWAMAELMEEQKGGSAVQSSHAE